MLSLSQNSVAADYMLSCSLCNAQSNDMMFLDDNLQICIECLKDPANITYCYCQSCGKIYQVENNLTPEENLFQFNHISYITIKKICFLLKLRTCIYCPQNLH